MTGRQDDRQDDRQRILDEYMIDILCVGYRVVVQRSNKSEGAFVYLYCDAQKVNKNSQKGAIDLRSAQGQKTTAFTSRYND
jgi:hypothetical protein